MILFSIFIKFLQANRIALDGTLPCASGDFNMAKINNLAIPGGFGPPVPPSGSAHETVNITHHSRGQPEQNRILGMSSPLILKRIIRIIRLRLSCLLQWLTDLLGNCLKKSDLEYNTGFPVFRLSGIIRLICYLSISDNNCCYILH